MSKFIGVALRQILIHARQDLDAVISQIDDDGYVTTNLNRYYSGLSSVNSDVAAVLAMSIPDEEQQDEE